MKQSEIVTGGRYVAKISGNVTTVRVIAIRRSYGYGRVQERTVYDVENLRTGRRTTFRSATKFRSPAPQEQQS